MNTLEYEGEKEEKLTDEDVRRLADALIANDKFSGPLELKGNGLSDLSALHLSRAIAQPGAKHLTKIDFSDNNLTTRAGEYIGEALLSNPEYPIYKLTFENISLEDHGLVRIIEAANANENIIKLHLGIITNNGLKLLADKLKNNEYLEELQFQETNDPQKLWAEDGRKAFTDMLRCCTHLKKVKAKNSKESDKDEADILFKQELDFYTSKKNEKKKMDKAVKQRYDSCDPTVMFEHMLSLVEDKDNKNCMLVRKFYKNTFDELLNKAIFALQKKKL